MTTSLIDQYRITRPQSSNNIPDFSLDNPSLEPELFYKDFGYFEHPATKQPVTQLADYQLESWKLFLEYQRILEVKTNKAGETSKWLLADFHLAVLPTRHAMSCMGYDQILAAQTKDHAKEHLLTLRKMIQESPKYSKYLIDRPSSFDSGDTDLRKLLRDEQTKTGVLYLYNPEQPTRPSRIIALGLENSGALASWKRIKNIHVSDATAAEGDIRESINYLMSRLANTNGSMVIETIPNLPNGVIYDMAIQYETKPYQKGDFKVYKVTAEQAVKAGVITAEFLESEKRRLGYLWPRYYGASFVGGSGNIFPYSSLQNCIKSYSTTLGQGQKVILADPGYGSSKFGIIVGERQDGKKYVKVAEEFERTSPAPMIERVAFWHKQCGSATEVYIDGSHPGFIEDLKEKGVYSKGVNFNEELDNMTIRASQDVKEGEAFIHPDFKELIQQLQIVEFDNKGKRDKKKVSFDLGDCFLMMCWALESNKLVARKLQSRF